MRSHCRATVDFSRPERDSATKRDLALNFSAPCRAALSTLPKSRLYPAWLAAAQAPSSHRTALWSGSLPQASWLGKINKTLRLRQPQDLLLTRSTVTGSGSWRGAGIARTGRAGFARPATLDLDSLLAQRSPATDSSANASQQGQSQTRPLRPVIADSDERRRLPEPARLPAAEWPERRPAAVARSELHQVQSEISSQQGLLTVSKMQGNLDGGQLSPGTWMPAATRRWRRSSRRFAECGDRFADQSL